MSNPHQETKISKTLPSGAQSPGGRIHRETETSVNKLQSSENIKLVKDKFMMTIYPNVDYAFVVTLIGIVEAMKSSNTKGEVAAGSGVGAVLGAVFS
ncbi:unnamed protein product [Lactuca virosa]|uniref:Uncharacterized protein n=1 Tax=Lactuca virosa TaxID=75947 RepID=A0AAU9N5W4_9ASTR|nr:unnamed protein product [Lactuca virosa]